jgi:CheY-like chemotaxis protein
MKTGKGRVLVVDDDRQMVATLCDVLELNGWKAQGAFTGGEALAAIRWPTGFDCILMDIKMPGMDGLAAVKAIRAERPDARIIVMTALAGPDPWKDAQRAGAARVLAKPVDPQRLLQIMDALCSSPPGAGQDPSGPGRGE